jgi:hypothetical protein
VEETPQPTATEEAPVLEPTPPDRTSGDPQVTDEPTAEAPAIEPTEAAQQRQATTSKRKRPSLLALTLTSWWGH